LWITEWACQNNNNINAQCSGPAISEFMKQTQGFMDRSPFVERYAWFGAMEKLQGVNPGNALMDGSGHINDLGKQYIGAATPDTNSQGSANAMSPPIETAISFALAGILWTAAIF